jgi:hypothetical protein
MFAFSMQAEQSIVVDPKSLAASARRTALRKGWAVPDIQ